MKKIYVLSLFCGLIINSVHAEIIKLTKELSSQLSSGEYVTLSFAEAEHDDVVLDSSATEYAVESDRTLESIKLNYLDWPHITPEKTFVILDGLARECSNDGDYDSPGSIRLSFPNFAIAMRRLFDAYLPTLQELRIEEFHNLSTTMLTSDSNTILKLGGRNTIAHRLIYIST